MMPVDRSEEDAKLELVRLDGLDDGEFTASDPDEEDEEDCDDEEDEEEEEAEDDEDEDMGTDEGRPF